MRHQDLSGICCFLSVECLTTHCLRHVDRAAPQATSLPRRPELGGVAWWSITLRQSTHVVPIKLFFPPSYVRRPAYAVETDRRDNCSHPDAIGGRGYTTPTGLVCGLPRYQAPYNAYGSLYGCHWSRQLMKIHEVALTVAACPLRGLILLPYHQVDIAATMHNPIHNRPETLAS